MAWSAAAVLLGGMGWLAGNYRSIALEDRGVQVVLVLAAVIGASAGLGATADLALLGLMLTAIVWFALLATSGTSASSVAHALVASASLVAALALLQYAGFDLFAAFGWTGVGGANARMRVFATLGNPNFVGAFLAGVLPLSLAVAQGTQSKVFFAHAAVALQAFGIAATGSRAAALGACIGCAVVFSAGARRRAVFAVLLIISVLAMSLLVAPVRSLGETAEGRLYVWRVTAPHLSSLPMLGHGPGAFEPQFNLWQEQYFQGAANAGALRFAAPFDHAHNDLLEWTIEFGWAGLLALVACAALFWIRVRRNWRVSSFSRGAVAGMCALACVSLVDFPLHRPAELFLLATLAAMALCASKSPPQIEKI